MAFGDADPSTPGFASVNTNWTTTGATCSAFSPPSGSLVRLWVFADTSAAANPGTETVTDTLAGATGWTFQGRRSKPDSGAQSGSVSLWTKFYAAAPGSIQVTVVGNATGATSGGFSTKVIAGCTGVESIVEGSNTSAVMSISVTTVTAGARCEMAGTDWNVAAAPTAGANQTAVLSSAVGTGPDTRVCVIVQNAVTAVAGTTETCSTGSPSTGNANNFMGLAYTPSAGATLISVDDAASAAEALTAAVTAPLADTAAASQALTVTAAVPLADGGSAADALVAGIAITLSDSGSATDALTVTVTVPLADAGTAGQTLGVTAALALADAAAALEALGVTATVQLAQAGSASDGLSVDAGGGTTKQLTDGGHAADSLCVCRVQLRPDTGTVARGATGTVTRPSTGVVRHCSCT